MERKCSLNLVGIIYLAVARSWRPEAIADCEDWTSKHTLTFLLHTFKSLIRLHAKLGSSREESSLFQFGSTIDDSGMRNRMVRPGYYWESKSMPVLGRVVQLDDSARALLI